MALEMVERDKDIGIHDRSADFGLLDILAVNRYQRLVGALEAVGNQDMAAGGKGVEAVLIGAVQMVQRIFAAADIQGVAVGQEGSAAHFTNQINDNFCVVWAQVSQISRFTEVNFDCCKFVLKINLTNAGFDSQSAQLFGQIAAELYLHGGEVYFRFFHDDSSLSRVWRASIF